LIQFLLSVVDIALVLYFILDIVVLVLFFVLHHFFVFVSVVDSFFLHNFLRIDLDAIAAVGMLILQVLNFLHEYFDLGPLEFFHSLHVSVKVLDPRLKLFDFGSGIVVEIMDHILF